MTVFETKDGIRLEFCMGGFYTTNESAIRKALEEDLASNNPADNAHASELLYAINRLGFITES